MHGAGAGPRTQIKKRKRKLNGARLNDVPTARAWSCLLEEDGRTYYVCLDQVDEEFIFIYIYIYI